MYGLCLCNEYINGVDTFINLAKKYMLDNIRGNLCCPYKHCKNEKRYRTVNVLISHLIKSMNSWRIIDVGINMGRRELMKQSREIHIWRERSLPVSKKVTMI
jgi:hypothetical protein